VALSQDHNGQFDPAGYCRCRNPYLPSAAVYCSQIVFGRIPGGETAKGGITRGKIKHFQG
jgi:hypothetical protein